MNRTNRLNQTKQTERLKSGQKCPVFRHCPKSERFNNRTISKNAEIRTFGFRTLTVPDILVGGPVEPLNVGSQVILDVARSLIGNFKSGKLGEDVFQWLTAHIGLQIQGQSREPLVSGCRLSGHRCCFII